ncbi:translation elongation factor Ts [Marinobacterium jannaschii]|uniref:translation elongation factor Ts n=1 Tax=Marinobacterium jannaschii TaxID=64970 RepID=UPI00048225B9|nr:translation elongation factor Ts [Marinobacterium jannaschii]
MAFSAKDVKELRDRTGLGMMECKKALAAADGSIEAAIEELRKASGMKAAKKAGRTAAEGIVVVKVAADKKSAVAVEVNSETDFAARDDNFVAFANTVAEAAVASKADTIEALMTDELNNTRDALVQKIGENITVRRIFTVEGDVVDAYVHSDNKTAAIVCLEGGNAETAKDIAMHVTAVNPQVVSKDDMPEDVVAKEKEIILAQPDMASKPAEIAEKMVIGRINKFLAENSLVEQPFVKNPDLKIGQFAKEAGAVVKSFTRIAVGEGVEVEEVDFAAEVAAQLKG